MKKLLLILFVTSSTFVGAQVLQSDNFDALTLGNVGTDFTGLTAGQGNWFTLANNGAAPTTTTNAGNSNFQIVASGASGQGVKIVGADGNKGSRFMFKNDLGTLWAARTPGNDIIEVEYDLYTGPASTSKDQYGLRLYGMDGASLRTLNGFVFNMDTKVLAGVAYLNNGGTFGTYLITLQTGGLILTADTWVRIGFAYDSTTGETIWKTPTVYTGLPAANWAGPFVPTELDVISSTPSTNTAVSEVSFDRITSKATAIEDLLGVAEVNAVDSFSIYPNPVKDVVTISNNNLQINKIAIIDINGRTIKNVTVDNQTETQVNISELNSGIYFLKVETNEGISTRKIVKQ